MHDKFAVHVFDTLAYLPDEENAVTFCQREVVRYDSFEELSACDAEIGYQMINGKEFVCRPQTLDRSHNEMSNSASL